jgi:hypothetical protein
MAKLCMITVPGLDVRSDWAVVHDRLLDDFPRISDVLATTIPETLLVVHAGRADIDAWLTGVSEAILARRRNTSTSRPAAAYRPGLAG